MEQLAETGDGVEGSAQFVAHGGEKRVLGATGAFGLFLLATERITIRSPSDYQNNVGFVFSDFPDMTVDMIDRFLTRSLADGSIDPAEQGLRRAIFGDDVSPPFDSAKIRAWLADIATNAEKRGLMARAFLDFVKVLQGKNPADYPPGESRLAAAVAGKIEADRKEFSNTLRARQLEATYAYRRISLSRQTALDRILDGAS